METIPPSSDSPTRTRTRQAILKAALAVFTENQAATLGDVADAAEVARSTLHRYFPERSDLVAGMKQYAEERFEAATERARHDEGTAAEALLRLTQEYFDEWHAIVWVYMESLNRDCQPDAITENHDPHLTTLIERGHAEGSIDSTIPNAWIQNLLWTFLYTASEYVKEGASRHEALSLATATFGKVLTPARPEVVPPFAS